VLKTGGGEQKLTGKSKYCSKGMWMDRC